MIEVFGLLWLPFLAALCLVGIHAYFGIQVLARKVVFVDLALAQVAALGATVAYMLGHGPQTAAGYGYSLAFTLLAALVLAFTRQWSGRISQEAIIGVSYVVAAAAAILLIDRAPQGAEHLKQILTGNILTVGWTDLAAIVPLYLAVAALHVGLRRRFAAADPGAWLSEFAFYAAFGVVVTSSVALAGVLLVFSFLIMPAAIGVIYADSETRQLLIGWGVGTLASLAGLIASYAFDLPTGAAMVCTFGAALALAGLARPLILGDRRRALTRAAAGGRGLVAAVLAASALWLLFAPRAADQPPLDLVEWVFPAARAAYMRDDELRIYGEAASFAERYRREVLRLTAMEVSSRSEGQALDDVQVMRIASLLKSTNEMRKGEEFVQREMRTRARERARWVIALPLLLMALLILPGGPRSARNLGDFMRSGMSSWLRR
jgi:zinc/manganese transport system permease protein